MITYNSKIVRYSAILLIFYVIWQSYEKNKTPFRKHHVESMQFLNSAQDSKHTIEIDDNKKYKDFTILEKFVYYFAKKDLPTNVRKNIEQTPPAKNN